MRREPVVEGGSKGLVRGETELAELVTPTDHPGLDLLPADFSYRRMDVHLHRRKNPATRLMKLMRPLRQRYACLILDCAPGMSLVSENVMHAADALVVPLMPSPLSVRMLEQLFEFVERKEWPDLRVLPFFSMVDRRKLLHGDDRVAPAALPDDTSDRSSLRKRVRADRAAAGAGRVLRSASAAARIYRALWHEIDGRLQGAAALRPPQPGGPSAPALRAV